MTACLAACMSVSEAVETLTVYGKNLSDSDRVFARDLYSRAVSKTKDLSEKQEYWLAEMARRARDGMSNANNAKRESVVINASAINEMFDNALSNGHKSPKIYFEGDKSGELRLTLSKSGSYPGTIQIMDRNGNWFGRILKDGTIHSKTAAFNVVEDIKIFCENPKEAVIKYGRKTGNCSFCAKELTTRESVSAGYGPICADKYGLPWG
jgi:hypothetical protein